MERLCCLPKEIHNIQHYQLLVNISSERSRHLLFMVITHVITIRRISRSILIDFVVKIFVMNKMQKSCLKPVDDCQVGARHAELLKYVLTLQKMA